MKFTALSSREQKILYLTVLVVIVGVVFNFFIAPVVNGVSGIDSEIARKEYMLKKYRYFEEKSRALNLSDNLFSADLTKNLTLDEAVGGMFTVVSEAAKKYSLNVQKIKPLPVGQGRSSKQAVLEVEVVGNFSAVFNFIDTVEESPLFIRVSAFHLAVPSIDSGNLRCVVAFSRVF